MSEQMNKQLKILLPTGHRRLHQSQVFPGRETLESNYWGSKRKCECNFVLPWPCPNLPRTWSSWRTWLLRPSHWNLQNGGCYDNIHRFSSCFCVCGMSMELSSHIHRSGSKIWYQNIRLNIRNHLLQNFIYFVRKKERKEDDICCQMAIFKMSLFFQTTLNKQRFLGGNSKV